MLAVLHSAGIPSQPAAWFGDIFGLYVAAQAFEESITEEGSAEEAAAAMGGYLASIPPERFPHLLASAGVLMEGGADERFEFGLDLLIRGLASHTEAGS